MKPTSITRVAISGVLALVAGAGIACSSKADASSFDSAYCHNARSSVADDLRHVDEKSPNPEEAGWLRYARFMDEGLRTAPKQLHSDWVGYHAAVAKQTAVVEKFGYSEDRFNDEATDADKAVMELSERVQNGVDRIMKYEAYTCGSGQPPAADVSFRGEKAGAYCDVLADDNENHESVDLGDPASLRKFLTDPASKRASASIDARFIATAPKVISDDVKAEVKWWNEQQKPTMAKYGYDMGEVFLHGSAKDVAAVQLTDKKVAEHYARALAYEEQVCGSDS